MVPTDFTVAIVLGKLVECCDAAKCRLRRAALSSAAPCLGPRTGSSFPGAPIMIWDYPRHRPPWRSPLACVWLSCKHAAVDRPRSVLGAFLHSSASIRETNLLSNNLRLRLLQLQLPSGDIGLKGGHELPLHRCTMTHCSQVAWGSSRGLGLEACVGAALHFCFFSAPKANPDIYYCCI